ncbi:hypothetical protein C4D27_17450 [Clostridium perfringens]
MIKLRKTDYGIKYGIIGEIALVNLQNRNISLGDVNFGVNLEKSNFDIDSKLPNIDIKNYSERDYENVRKILSELVFIESNIMSHNNISKVEFIGTEKSSAVLPHFLVKTPILIPGELFVVKPTEERFYLKDFVSNFQIG